MHTTDTYTVANSEQLFAKKNLQKNVLNTEVRY